VTVRARDGHTKSEWEVAHCELHDYPATLRRLWLSNPQPDRVAFFPMFSVPRQSVARVIQTIAYALDNTHQSGVAHGDLKPPNILLSREGAVPIDSLQLAFGDLSPAVSPGWVAPEQLLLQRISAAADVYPLGVMLVSLLGGSLTGERATYVIPSDTSSEGMPIEFFKNPRVYLDPKGQFLPRKSVIPWLEFIERCLRFDPLERPEDAAAFATGLDQLLAAHPIADSIRFSLGTERQLAFVHLPDGAESTCCVVRDDWSMFYQRSMWEHERMQAQQNT
jgi:serine/threonine protein kinase